MKHYIAIEKGDAKNLRLSKRKSFDTKILLYGYVIGIIIIFFLLFIRLTNLTIVKGSYYAQLADNNRTREVILEAPRGDIIDRKGILLATSRTTDPSDVKNDRGKSERVYNYPMEASHVLGYVQTADETDISQDSCQNRLLFGDSVGKKGVESLYECHLRGEHGQKLIEFDATGEYKQTLGLVKPTKGKDIQLALDINLQKKAYSLMENKVGAIIAVKPQTGELLTLVSTPSYDPTIFENDPNEATTVLQDESKPLFNRATEGVYPPGSTFKMFVASAGLEEGVISKNTEIEDNGFIKAGPLTFHNWYYLEYGRTEGLVDVVKSLQRSNDIFYYELGGKLGPSKIKQWAEKFGFNQKSEFGLSESAGLIPSQYWKEDVLNEQWFLGDSFNLSIGQGYVSATPLQVTMATAVFANNKNLCTPQIKKTSVGSQDCAEVPLSDETYELIREGMKKVCEPGGTAYPLYDFRVATPSALLAQKENSEGTTSAVLRQKQIELGCKTGTAESHAQSGKPHAWFTVFAPFDKPEIVVTVLVEEGGQGSEVASPIAKELLQFYFEQYE